MTETKVLNFWNKTEHWERLLSYAEEALALSTPEASRLSKSPAAEIIAATAYISGCDSPDRTIISHWGTLISAVRCRKLFDHKQGESLQERFQCLAHFPGGDQSAIKAGLLLLELLSLNDHKEDRADDILNTKYNPLVLELSWEDEYKRLLHEFEQLPVNIKTNFRILKSRCIQAKFWL